MLGTTEERNILDSYDSMLENPTKIFPSFIGINTTKCGTTDRIFRLDVGMSKTFDYEDFYKEFAELYREVQSSTEIVSDTLIPASDLLEDITVETLEQKIKDNPHYIKKLFFLLVKYILSRAPQLLHITTSQVTEVFRASLTNTLKYMCRNNSKIIPPDGHILYVPFYAIIAFIDNTTIKVLQNTTLKNYLS
jgi:hypothetical protein